MFTRIFKMEANRKRKRVIQDGDDRDDLNSSYTVEGCGFSAVLSSKRRRKSEGASRSNVWQEKENQMSSASTASNMNGLMLIDGKKSSHQSDFGKRTLRRSLRRRVSMSLMRQKMKNLQDYSLPYALPSGPAGSCRFLNDATGVCNSPLVSLHGNSNVSRKDHEMQQKIDYEIKMREGTARLLAASKHPTQLMEAAKNLLTSNTRIIAYMAELQRRKAAQSLGNGDVEGSQVPCKAKLNLSDLRIPLMWKDSDHFKNKGDHRRFAVFCLVKIGTEIYDTSLISNVDRNMTDLSFEDVIAFDNISHDFECVVEIYSHKLEDLTMASTPKKIKKKVVDLSESVGRSVGKRLSGLHDSDIMGNMVLGPKFELVATGKLTLQDVDDVVKTFDLKLEDAQESGARELPLFGHYCCRVAALPHCLVQPAVSGYLSLRHDDDDLTKWRRYWCILKNLQVACWSSPEDVDVTAPLVTVPVTKNTQICEADPRSIKKAHTFHVKTLGGRFVAETTLAADDQDQFTLWWDGLQQHLLDQALWKQACEYIMDVIRAPSHRKSLVSLGRKTSIYDDTPIHEPSSRLSDEIKLEDDKLSQMLNTLMGEAKEIRSGSIRSTSSSSGSLRSTSSS